VQLSGSRTVSPRGLSSSGSLTAVVLGGAAGYALSSLLRLRQSSIISIAAAAVTTPPGAADHGHSAAAPHAGSQRLAGLVRLLRHPSAARLRPAVPLAVAGLTFGLAELAGAEPLLACVAVGLVASNWRCVGFRGLAQLPALPSVVNTVPCLSDS
jgi:hypothetical protein